MEYTKMSYWKTVDWETVRVHLDLREGTQRDSTGSSIATVVVCVLSAAWCSDRSLPHRASRVGIAVPIYICILFTPCGAELSLREIGSKNLILRCCFIDFSICHHDRSKQKINKDLFSVAYNATVPITFILTCLVWELNLCG